VGGEGKRKRGKSIEEEWCGVCKKKKEARRKWGIQGEKKAEGDTGGRAGSKRGKKRNGDGPRKKATAVDYKGSEPTREVSGGGRSEVGSEKNKGEGNSRESCAVKKIKRKKAEVRRCETCL